jgi:energy-converting hydrogenase Eha subunit A
MALCFLFSLCMHSALVHHFPHSLSLLNAVATSFYLPSLRQTKPIRTEADFQIFRGPSLAAIPEIIAIKKFKIYLHSITFIGLLSILVNWRMQRTPLGVQFSLKSYCVHTFVLLAKPGRPQCFLCGSIAPVRGPQPARPAASLHCDAVPKATK